MATNNPKKVWIRTDPQVRIRLNLYKALAGLPRGGELDQSDAIAALLDAVGAPVVPEHAGTPSEATHG